VAQLWGLEEARIGDWLGEPRTVAEHHFSLPTLESVVVAEDGNRLRVALLQLAEQDPLINVRQDGSELSVSLYGEVQKEVIQATLAAEYGIAAEFRETIPIYIERPVRAGEALEVMNTPSNPHHATMGLRVEPASHQSGIAFESTVDHSTVPLITFKTMESFLEHVEAYVREAAQSGPHGWQVTDVRVTFFVSGYSGTDGPPSQRGSFPTAGDYRKLTSLVLTQALSAAGTVVCEPVMRVRLEIPADTIGTVTAAAARLGGVPETPSLIGALAVVETTLPAARVDELQRHLPGLTSGEGVLESTFAGHQAVKGPQPTRLRTSPYSSRRPVGGTLH
jgi:ribosomal protection tetracycline resistance protein